MNAHAPNIPSRGRLPARFAFLLLLSVVRVQAAPDSEPLKVIVPTRATSASSPMWSADYASRIRAAIVPYIAWAEEVQGNPVAEVEIRTSPDGAIVQAKLLKGSGVESWDQSVQTALAKVGRIPLDVNGQVPPVLVMSFRPRVASAQSVPAVAMPRYDVPARLVPGSCGAPAYPAEAKARNEQGKVVVTLYVLSSGEVGDAAVHTSSKSDALDQETRAFAVKCKFTPATKAGRPVESLVRFPVDWKLE